MIGINDLFYLKDIVYIIIKNSIKQAVYDAIIKASEKKSHFGVMFTLNTPDFIRAGHLNERAEDAKG